MLTNTEIMNFISEDATSDAKRFAKIGARYYEGNHDIRNYRLFYYNADGNLVEDTTRSNLKIPHPFFTEIVDQATQYMLSGKEGFVKSDLPELQKQLDAYFNENEDFTAELYELISGCMAKGYEYMFAYKKADGKTAFQAADSIGVVEVRAKDTDDHCEYIIYWYVDRVEKGHKLIKRIQVWDESQVCFFVSDEAGKIEVDDSVAINPRPHVVKVDDRGNQYDGGGFGFIPFFRLDNCRKRFSDIKPIKDLIDDYDLMASSLSNNLVDFDTPIHVVRGFQGDSMDELITNLKTKKTIGVDNEGGVDVQTVDVPYSARVAKLDLDEKNIYRFGMGFNSAQLGDGNITNIVIKSRYALLDLKCNKLEIRLKQFMRKILKIVLQEINDEEGTDYQLSDVYFDFEREVMTNAADNAQIELIDAQKQQVLLNSLMGVSSALDSETILQSICDILDIDYEEVKEKVEAADEIATAQNALNRVVIDDEQTTEAGSAITA